MLILILLVVSYFPLRMAMESGLLQPELYNAIYIFGTALQVLFAGVIITAAVRTGARSSVGRQWLLLGIGVAMYAIGDVIWTYMDILLGANPYPSVADFFYVSEYAFFLAAIVLAIRSYSGLVKTKTAWVVAVVVGVLGIAAVYFLLLKPFIFPAGTEELGFWGLVVSTLYPVGDVLFMLAPAVALALVVAKLRAGILARPWWAVVAGALVFAFTDSAFAYVDWAGSKITPAIDMGWIVANLLFAIAAMIGSNVYRTKWSSEG